MINTIQEADQINSVKRSKVNDKKDKVSICKLCIISKAYIYPFLCKYKHANVTLDVVVSNLVYFDITTFGGAKWLVVLIDKYISYCSLAFL